MDIIQFAILGIGVGAVYGVSGLGLVLTYRGAGILNFAHGAIGMVGAYVFATLAAEDVPLPIAVGCGILAGAGLGVVVHVFLMRPLRRAAALMRVVATLAVLAILQEVALLIWGSGTRLVPSLFPVAQVSIGDFRIGIDRLIILSIAVVAAVVLTFLYNRTRFGLATTAMVENRRGAAALGWSPSTIALTNWALGGGLAAIAGILIVPAVGLNPSNLTLMVIPALAAALIGQFSSFWLTIVGGVVIGMVESAIAAQVDVPGLSRAVPFVAIALVVALRGNSLPMRGEFLERLPSIGTGRVRWWAVLLVPAAVLVLSLFVEPRWTSALIVSFSVAIILLSLVVLTGYAGQLSLAQYSLAGFGALITASMVYRFGWDLAPSILVGLLISLVMGVIIGAPALRTRGVNLAVVTLVLGQAIYVVLLQNAKVIGTPEGTPIGNLTFLGIDISGTRFPVRYLALTLVVFVICALVTMFIRRSRVGRRLVAVRENERAAAAMGVSVRAAKLYAFAVSSAMAALGGIMLSFQHSIVNYGGFDIFTSIHAVLMSVLGGVGYVIGVPFGMMFARGSILQSLLEQIGPIEQWITLIGALGLLVVILTNQDGFGGYVARLFVSRRKRTRPVVPLPVDDGGADPQRVRPAVLEVRGLTVRYGGVVAVDNVDIDIRPGEVVGLIGPNGAGKTSFVDAVSGHFPGATGSVKLDGVELIGRPAHQRARRGMVRTFQSLELFEGLTVEENLLAACDDQAGSAYAGTLIGRAGQTWTAPAVAAINEFGLSGHLAELPDNLPHGVRRLVAVARGVAQAPSVLLMDEPASGISMSERQHLTVLIRRLADAWGMGVLLIEHDVSMVMAVCDRVAVLKGGRLLRVGTPDEVRNDPSVLAAYLGGDAEVAADELDDAIAEKGAAR
jgi:ABC-type branched-subunit amino acid transport system ATPase component/branched-subunit amino acid ABC-type transport system permease component